ncbi:MAG: hypothetical protein RL328_428, partial [Acidobacteriota bacterium]
MTRNLTIEKSSRVAKLMSTLPLRAMVGLVGALLLSAASAWAQGNFVGLRPEFQYYYPSYTGYHLFDVSGALGAPASNGSHAGGKGARIQGYMYLQKGDILQIAAGGYGVPGVPAGNNVAGGGGGGGSSIVLSSGPSCGTTWPSCPRPLVFAGGGGGGTADQDGGPGLISNAAPPRGGVDSRGGKAVASGISSGGGGGGYETSGEDPGYSWNQAESPGGL